MKSFVEIDQNALDEEWVEQPKMYHLWATKLAKAKAKVAAKKAALDLAEAESRRRIRKNPAKYGVPKLTDATLKAAATLHPHYQAALAEYNSARYKQDVYEAAVKALEHRKAALQDLVFLWGQSYFAGKMKTSVSTDSGVRDRLQNAEIKAGATRKRKT